MAKPGPKKTPTAILEARGSWLAKVREGEPVPPDDVPTAPEWLKGDALAMWNHLAPRLLNMRVLTCIDSNALARYCDAWARWRAAAKFIDERGEMYPLMDENGKAKGFAAYPQVLQYHKLAQLLGKLEGDFGLTPAARAGLTVAPEKHAHDGSKSLKLVG